MDYGLSPEIALCRCYSRSACDGFIIKCV